MRVSVYHQLNVCVDGDGLNELVVAYTDRVVRAYRWSPAEDSSSSPVTASPILIAADRWLLTGQVHLISADIIQVTVQVLCGHFAAKPRKQTAVQ